MLKKSYVYNTIVRQSNEDIFYQENLLNYSLNIAKINLFFSDYLIAVYIYQ